jgi:ATP-dependent helicase/nuclease subunit A
MHAPPAASRPSPSREQRAAADPAQSVWVSANAGAGKTTVLVDRVVRLMLAGADPARILCLTFTKAAAANMQNRVFDRLGGWVALPDGELAAELDRLTGEPPAVADLAAARRLFARAVETPGGLKIQTIHAFCERLLHLFPFEAAVPARFEMLDDSSAAAAMQRATAATLRAALLDGAGALGAALKQVTAAAGEGGFRDALKAFIAHRRTMDRGLERKFAGSAMRAALGLAPGETSDVFAGRMRDEGLPDAVWKEICGWLDAGSSNDQKCAGRIRAARQRGDVADIALVFLTEKGTRRASLATDKLAKARPDLIAILDDEGARVIELLERHKSAIAAERTEAISLLADDVLGRYAAEKRRLGRLDFADLIGKTRTLLSSDTARWVVYKLDQGVDHVLVDEAQDTSPEQWDIVKALTDEFFVGEGARGGARRTIFAVGDEKQSIFSFQGARPEAFDAARRHYAQRIDAYNGDAVRKHAFAPVPLYTSYRTTQDVLDAVDAIFGLPANAQGLDSESRPTKHDTSRAGKPGLVELWPPEPPPPKADTDPEAPVDSRPPDSGERRLADRIARRVHHWRDADARLDADGKPIAPGDVLVLVRSRGPIFEEVIKALKKHGVPVAGADRMTLLDQIAVMDLISLGRFCLLPEDDLALAEVLKSPLIGFDDAALERVAAGRKGVSLWSALQAAAGVGDVFARLSEWLALARAADPLRFYGGVLSGGGRARLIGRLGPDAAEAIDVFLYRLRQWQAANPPSLALFLAAMAGDESDVKRDMEEAHGRVRVMTVHGSKGLEAPVVFLADAHHKPDGKKGPKLLLAKLGDPATAVWTPRKPDEPAALAESRRNHEAQEAAEHRRLLYVALTRARDRLYICGVGKTSPHPAHWREMIDAALAGRPELRNVPDEAGEGEVLQWRTVDVAPADKADVASASAKPAIFPWLRRPAPVEPGRPPPLRPSRLADAAEPPPLREATARRSLARQRGDLIHLLLQHLPDLPTERRATAGAALAAARGSGLDADMRAEALASALALIADPRWAALFAPGARAEAEIAGKVPLNGRFVEVAGRIDRLAIAPDRVIVLDYKTGRMPRDPRVVSESHLRQLAVYRALAQDLYPGRRVETAILWTAGPEIVVLEEAALDAAMARMDDAMASLPRGLAVGLPDGE